MSTSHYLHNRAGVTALLAALADKEGSIRFAVKQVLRLYSVQVPYKPALLIVMWQIFILLTDKVGAVITRENVLDAVLEPVIY